MPTTAEWYTEGQNAAGFVAAITPKAAKSLKTLAANGPQKGYDDLQKMLEVNGEELSGRWASVRSACQRLNCPPPFTRDERRRIYTINPQVADALLDAMGQV